MSELYIFKQDTFASARIASSVNAGSTFEVFKDTSDKDEFDYTISNTSVTLISKDPSAVCRVRITGAN